MKNNKLKIRIESRNIYHENTDTNESIYSFFRNQESKTKKWIDFQFVLSDDYNDHFMKHLVNIKDGEDENMIYSPIKTQNFRSIISMIT